MPFFSQPSTYTLSAQYECAFIPCGPFSTTKTIVVKDTMSIKSDDNTLCKGDTGHYTTWHGNSVTWRVYNQTNVQIHSSNAASLDYVFVNAGRYKVVASNPNYCEDAEYWTVVLDNPPALAVTSGPHEACPGSSILLSAVPTHPKYYLEWETLCSPGADLNGNEVTVSYGGEVCDVAVYQVDAQYGCRSAAFIHTVDTFQLAPLGIPDTTVVCAGSTLQLTAPAQNNVTYQWTMNPANAASIVGNHLQPSVNILTNHFFNTSLPFIADVELERIYCSILKHFDTVHIQIDEVIPPTLSYPTEVCQYESVTFTAAGGTSVSSHYTWQFSDTSLLFNGPILSRIFDTPGTLTFTLTYQPNPDCNPVTVTGSLYVSNSPVVNITRIGDTLQVPYSSSQSYVWTHNGDTVGTTNVLYNTQLNETYCCTVTSNGSPQCTATNCCAILYIPTDTCNVVSADTITQNCNEVTVKILAPVGLQYDWSISTNAQGSHITTLSADSAVAYFYYPGTHYIYAYADLNGLCYRYSRAVTIDCIPQFDLSYNCNGYIVVTDKSLYRSGYTIPDRTYTIVGGGSVTMSYPTMTDSIYIGNPSNSTYTVNMVMDNSNCTLSETITLEPNPTISSIDIPSTMCENTPFLFSATTTGNNLEYIWDFGDNSYNYGNGIYHTYSNSNYSYLVSLIVTNNLGCNSTANAIVDVVHNNLTDAFLRPLSQLPICPGNVRIIQYMNPLSSNSYVWMHNNTVTLPSTNYQYPATETGDYTVKVKNSVNGCRVERMLNVAFLNAPTARITGNTTYCFGEEVKLFGNTGSNNNYVWTITGPGSYTGSTANITFTPSLAGTYQVHLEVTSSDGCVDSAYCTLSIHPQPTAPPISFYNNECIHTPPVFVHSTASPSQNLLWSNGFHGTSAQYYTPGYLTAHYIDSVTGCSSAKSSLFIPPAPNYDALLTGCYRKCDDELPTTLNVYHIYPYDSSSFYWKWYRYSTLLASGNSLSATLPVNAFGNYYMVAQYGNGCNSQSPYLTISPRDYCPCDSITVSVSKECRFINCNLVYNLSVTICNHGSQTVCFNQLYTNASSSILNVTTLPVSITPGNCQTIYVNMTFLDYSNPYIEFTLFNQDLACETTFTEYFNWRKCVMDDCKMTLEKMLFLTDLSTPHQTSYFNLFFDLPNNTSNVVAFWSEPSQILTFNYISPSTVDAVLMLNYGLLSQMVSEGGEICFHAILCLEDGTLCYATFCISAKELFELVPNQFRRPADETKGIQSGNADETQISKPYLAPNPAENEVTVMGLIPESVAEITVLTMDWRHVLMFKNDYSFSVSSLSDASYIVRVITTDKKVYYLKLVKV